MIPEYKSPGSSPLLFPAAIAATFALLCQAGAATWDITPGTVGAGNGVTAGGSGTWNTTNGNWTIDAGANNIAWNNATNDPAVFGGTAGTVNLTTGITAGSITFNTTGYSVTGNILTLGGAVPTITVATGLTASISSEITGAVLNIGTATTGLGTLTISGTNTHTGLTNVNYGTVNVQNSSAFGSIAAGTAVANGAGLSFQGGVNVLNETLGIRGAGVGNAGGLRNISGNNRWTGLVTLTNSLRITSNSGTLTLGAMSATGRTIIMNGPGNVTVEGEISGAGGAVSVDNAFDTANPSGTLTLKGADTFTGVMTVTNGTLSLDGTRTAASGAIIVGDGPAQTATLDFKNGNFSTAANNITVGSTPASATTGASGTGIVNHSAGTLSTDGLILLGSVGTSATISAGTGTYHLSGGSLKSTSTNLAAMCLGTNTGGTATFNLSGSGLLEMSGVGGLLQIGRSSSTTTLSTGTFSQTGGTATLLNVAMGNSSNSNTASTLILTGGTFAVSTGFTAMAAGATSTASITIGGTADVTLPAFPTLRGAGSTASITFDGGKLKPAAASSLYLGGLTIATIQDGGATFEVATGKNITISQNLLAHGTSTGGGLTKLGTGALTLSGACTYTGNTTVTGGTLAVDGSLAPASAVTVASTATLAGGGTIGGTITSSGTISPGNGGVGTLTTGPATLTGGNLAIQVSNTTADQLISTGAIQLTGSTLAVTELATGTAYSYIIVEGTGITGTFASTSLPAGYTLEYTATRVILHLAVTIDGYVTWASVNGLNETNRVPEEDPDNDGINNLMEYVLGGIPTGPGAGNTSILPTPSLQANHLVFTYERPFASRSDTTQVVQTSTNLTTWTNFATVGATSAGAVTIAPESGDMDSVSVAIPRGNAVAGKLFARLAVDPGFPYLGKAPGMMEILEYWAPVVYQEVRTNTDIGRQLYGARDCMVAINFDGDWDVANNWNNSRYQPAQQGLLADRLTPTLQAKVYASMIESGLFYFLTYAVYHSGQDSYFSAARHQNDMELVVMTVRKDDSQFGMLEGLMTQFHTEQKTYLPAALKFSGHRPIVHIESNGGIEGHGIEAYSNQNTGSDGVVYLPGSSSENVTTVTLGTSGNWATAPQWQYKLIPISEMWGQMGKTGLYDPYSDWIYFNYARAENYPDLDHEPQGGNPPWKSDFFHDPFTFFATALPNLQPELAADTYIYNPYLNGLRSQGGPSNPNGVLPSSAWQKTQLGGTSGFAWTHRAETTLYHRSGTGTGDRITFNQSQVTGNFSIQGRVQSVQDLGANQTGLMIRNSLTATSRMIQLWVGADMRVHLQYRTLDGGSVGAVINGDAPLDDQPVWLRLERNGGQIIAAYSYTEDDGDFTVLANVALPMTDPVSAGMVVSSTNTTYYSASTVTDLEVKPKP